MVSASGYTLFATTARWNIWATPSVILPDSSFITAIQGWGDQIIPQIEADLGYSIFPLSSGLSFDGMHMDLVFDDTMLNTGGARAGTLFGTAGMSMDPNFLISPFNGISDFWVKILQLHETINVWTGAIAQGWPTADGSPLWGGSSPFPNMCDVIITRELGETLISDAQAARELPDKRVKVFYDLQQLTGWATYRKFFQLVQQEGVTNWYTYNEPLRTSILAYFLVVSGAPSSFYTSLMNAGIAITQTSIADAIMAFPNLSQLMVSNLTATPTSALINEQIVFALSVVGGISPYHYSWDFGDGTTQTIQNPLHGYTLAGNYTAKVTVTDSNFTQTSAMIDISVTTQRQSNNNLVAVGAILAGAVMLFYASNRL